MRWFNSNRMQSIAIDCNRYDGGSRLQSSAIESNRKKIDRNRLHSTALDNIRSIAFGSIRLLSIAFAIMLAAPAVAAIDDVTAAEAESNFIRFEGRSTYPGKIAHGTVAIAEPDGATVTDWDSTAYADGWQAVTSGTNTAELAVINNTSIAIEGGRLQSNTTWSSNVTHLVRNTVYVPSGVTLTVTTNAIVKFCEGTAIKVEDGGKLNVVGASGSDVIFTAANDAMAGEAIVGVGEQSIAFDGIRLQSTAAIFADNGYFQSRGFSYGAFPSVTLNDSMAFRSFGKALVQVTISGSTRNAPFSIDWVAVDGTAKYGDDYTLASGTVNWTKSGDGTKTIEIPLVTDHLVGTNTTFTLKVTTNRCVNVARAVCTIDIRELDTLPIDAAEDESDYVRFESRATYPGKIAHGTVAIGDPDGTTVTDWDSTAYADGWQAVTSGTNTAELAVINNTSIVIEGGRLQSNATWTSNATHLVRNTVYVPSGVTLTITESAVVKFCEETAIKVEDGGKLNVVGVSGSDVIFTAANDSTAGEAIAGVDAEQPIAFGGIRLQSTAAKFTDNGWLQTRGFNYGSFPTVTLHDATAHRRNGKIYIAATIGGTTRNQSFTLDWAASDGTAKYGEDYTLAGGRLTWAKSGDGTKWIEIPLKSDTLAGSSREFGVAVAVARGVNVAKGAVTARIDEYENCGLNDDVVAITTNVIHSADFKVQENIGLQPIFLSDCETVQYSGRWQKYDTEKAKSLKVTLSTDNGTTVLKETTPDDTGAVELRLADWPVGYYTLKHEIDDGYGEVLSTMSKTFSIADREDVELHGGTLTQNETWTADKVHVVYATVYVPSLYTLFVEPGAVVKFMTGTGIDISQGGAFFGNGIIFTHINDDTVGGDTLSDGFTVAPPMDAYELKGNFTFGDDTELRNITQNQALTGTISANKMLSKGSTYRVSGTLTVASGATLTIPAGTILKMESGASIVVNSGATLNAIGTRAAPIIFTSIKDDSVSGDTNGDGDATIPQPGDWVKIGVNGGTANFEHVEILYSSKNSTTGAINMNGGVVRFVNSEISHGLYDAVGVESGNFYMTNSIITDCLLAFRHWPKDPIVNSVVYDCGRLTQGGGQTFVNCIFSEIVETWEAFGFPKSTYRNCCFWNENGSILTGEGTQDAMTVCGKDGNIWGDPLFVDPENGDFRIVEGSPCVDAADSSAAPETDFYGQPRVTITEQSSTNLVGQLADIGICEVMPRDMTSDIDLVPQLVRADTNAVPGQLVFVKWEVKNAGGVELDGAWRDTISFVSETGREVTLGTKTTTGVIAPGGSIFCSGYFTVPPISEGEWYPKVNVNSYRDVFEGALGVNNALVGDRVINVGVKAIDPSQSRDGVINGGLPTVLKFTFGEDDENRMMKIDVLAGVKVTWGFGFMPQGASASGSMTAADGGVMFRVPNGAMDVYVILESEDTAEYGVSTEMAEMVITGVSPNTLPSSGTTTLVIAGAGFGENCEVSLSTATDSYRVQSTAIDNSGNIIATVDCSSLKAGQTYALTVESGDLSATVKDAVAVTKAEGKGELEANLIIPSQVRIGRVNTGYVQYSNVGSANMLAPIFRIDSQEVDTLVSLNNSGVFSDTSVRLVGIGAANPNGVLMPGDVMRLPFYFIVKGRGAYNFKLSILNTDLKDFRDSVFETWGEFALEISNAATCLNGNGKMVCDYDKIYQLAMRKGYGDSTGMVCGQLIDVNSGVVMAKDRLVLCETNGTKIAISETDDNGRFNFDGLKVGELYSIESQTSQFREYIIANNGIGDVYYAAPLASVAVNIEGVETDDISAVLLNDGDRVHQMKLSESDSTYIIKDLVDGVYSLNIEIEGYQCVTSDVSYIIYAGCVTNTPEKIVAVPSGHAVISLIDETSTPIVGEACVLRNVVTGFEFQSFTKENGKAYFNCPSGKYALEAGNGLSVDQEVTIEIVNGEDVVLSVVAKKVPFALYPPMGAVPLTVVGELAFTNSLKSIAQCQWDFNGDGIWDAKGLVATNIYNNASSYNVAVKLLFSDGDEQVFSQNAAVETWNEDKIEYVDDALVLDTMSGYRIVEKEGARIVLSITGEMPPKALFEGMVIVDPNDKLQPYEIISFDAIDNQTLVLDVKVVTLEKAYRTFQVSSLRSPLLYSSGDSGFNLDNYDGRAKINLEPKLSLDALKEYGLEGALQGNAGLDVAIHIQNKKLRSLSVSTVWNFTLEAKSKLDGEDSSKKYRRWKKTRIRESGTIPNTDKQILVGYMPIRVVGKWSINGELSGKVKISASSKTVRKYTQSKGWEKIAPDPNCDVTFEGKLSFWGGFNVECGIGVGRTAAGKDYGFNLGDVKAEIGAKIESKIEYHFDEFTSDKFTCWAGPYFKLTGKICHLKLGSWGDLSLMDISPLEFNWKLFNWEWQTPMPDFSCEFPNGMICVNSVDVNFLSKTDAGESKFVERSWDLGGVDGGSGSTARRSFPCKPKDKTYYTIYLREKYQPTETLASWLPTATKATKKEIWVKGDDSDDDDGDYDDGGELGGVVVDSNDPNEMAGPLGVGDPSTERFVKPGDWMTYTVYFENLTNATAAAQEVYVTNPLSEWLDWSTFEMGEVSFGNQIDLGLSGKSSGTTEKRMDGTNWIVRTELSIEPDTTATDSNRQQKMCAKWYLRIVDPSTDTGWPVDPVAGFLPPNDPETHCGEGHLTYRIRLREDAPAGLVITNSASIVFDYNEPIVTDPAWWNTVAPETLVTEITPEEMIVNEGGVVEFKVFGGNVTKQSSVQVLLAYNTAAAADLDLTKASVRRVGDNAPYQTKLKFPLTLTWEAGEIGEKVISIPVKIDKAIEADEFFTLQLANPKNMSLGDADVCTVTIHDPGYDELKSKVDGGTATKKELSEWNKLHPGKAYVRPLASPATGGKVTGGALVVPGKAARLKATALAGFVFAGWYTNAACVAGQELTGYGDYRNPSLAYTATNINVDVFARFIPVEEDYLSLGEDFLPSQIRTNAQISIYVPVESASLPNIRVTGLPTGLKFYAKETLVKATKTTPAYIIPANTIYGTAPKKPTAKPATITVTVKNAGKYAITRKYLLSIVDGETVDEPAEVVSDAPQFYSLAVDVSDDFAGKVTGTGVYQAGKKVTAKATANKGYVFNGWYRALSAVDGDRGQLNAVDSDEMLITQAASYAFTMPEEDVALVAKFVTAEEDAASIALVIDALGGQLSDEGVVSVTNLCGVALKWPVAVSALSQPSVKVAGLPAGLKFTAKDIVDRTTKQVNVPANTIYGAPTAESRLDTRTGLRKPSTVKITVTTAGKNKRIYPVEMTILPIPDWVLGTFNGGGEDGQVTLTIAKTGKMSGKYLSNGLTWTLSAASFDSCDDSGDVYRATLIGKSGKLMTTNEVGIAHDAMGGFAESIDYIAYQNNWKLEPWKTIGVPMAKAAAVEYEDTALVVGEEVPGVISLKFASAGTVKAAGTFITGVDERTGKDILYKASCSAVLAPQTEPDENGAFEGVFFVYFPPKVGKFDGYVRCLTVRWDGEAWSVIE